MSCSSAARRAVFGAGAELVGHHRGELRALDRVREHVLPVARAEAAAGRASLHELGVEAVDVGLEDGLLAAPRRCGPRARTSPGSRSPRCAPGGCARPASSCSSVMRAISRRTPSKPDSTTAFGRVVDDEVDAGEVLERADVAALAADDAALHVVGGQLDDGDRRLGRVAGGEALHRDGEDRAHAALGVALGLLLDLAQRSGRESWRAWSSTSLSSACLACAGAQPATRSSALPCSLAASSSSAALALERRSRSSQLALRARSSSRRALARARSLRGASCSRASRARAGSTRPRGAPRRSGAARRRPRATGAAPLRRTSARRPRAPPPARPPRSRFPLTFLSPPGAARAPRRSPCSIVERRTGPCGAGTEQTAARRAAPPLQAAASGVSVSVCGGPRARIGRSSSVRVVTDACRCQNCAICCDFSARCGPVVSLRRIVVPRRRSRRNRSARASVATALEGAHRVVGELELVALAHEQAERALALAVVAGGARKRRAQQRDRGLELVRRRRARRAPPR